MKSYIFVGVVGGAVFGALNTSGTEVPAIYSTDSSLVGIGATNPPTKLVVAPNISTTTLGGAAQYGGIHLQPNGTNNTITGITFGANGGGGIYTTQSQAGIICQTSDQYGTQLFFQTTNSYGAGCQNRMTITAAGRVGIGSTAPAYDLELINDSAGKPGTGGLWTVTSDIRLKKDIIPADTNRCIDIIKSIPLKRYTWRDEVYTNEQVKDRSALGWIAQDVEKIFPKAVGQRKFNYNKKYEEIEIKNEDGTIRKEKKLISEDVIEDCRDLNADQLYAVMYGAIQQLITDKEVLTQTVANQASTISTLQSNLSSLMKWVGYS